MSEAVRTDGPWVRVPQRVIMGDTDAMGIVYYGTYLRFLERARNEYLRARGGSYRELEEAGYGLPVTEVGLKYRAPARCDDLLEVALRVEELRRVTLRFVYEVTRPEDAALLATGFTVHACIASRSGRAARLPELVTRCVPEG